MTKVELVSGNWLGFSNGSRPESNNIRFWKSPNNIVWLEMSYVFDWNTYEIQSFSFAFSQQEFDNLIDLLLLKGYAELLKVDEHQDFHFEWKSTPSGFAFRIKGRNTSVFECPVQVEFIDFHYVNCGAMVV